MTVQYCTPHINFIKADCNFEARNSLEGLLSFSCFPISIPCFLFSRPYLAATPEQTLEFRVVAIDVFCQGRPTGGRLHDRIHNPNRNPNCGHRQAEGRRSRAGVLCHGSRFQHARRLVVCEPSCNPARRGARCAPPARYARTGRQPAEFSRQSTRVINAMLFSREPAAAAPSGRQRHRAGLHARLLHSLPGRASLRLASRRFQTANT